MEAKELRIGNLVFDGKGVYEVSLLTFQKDNEQGYYFKNLSPIRITGGWLKRFGFEKNENGEYEIQNTSFFYSKSKEHTDYWVFRTMEYDTIEVKYVHQLQNLYFAITGKELEFKIKQ